MAEITLGQVAKIGGGLFDLRQLYGRETFWTWTLGVRLGFGGGTHRMGRYGAAIGGTLHRHRDET
jgi:hypothetical protein